MLFPLLLLAIAAVVLIFWQQIAYLFLSIERFEAWIDRQGIYAPLLFVAAQFFQVVVFVIPGEVPQIAAGYLFGFWLGTLLSVTGILLGSAVSFLLARFLGVPFVLALFRREAVERVQRFARSGRALPLFFLVFLIPGIPKDVLCYAAGLTAIRLPVFLLVSTVARVPGIAGSAFLGKAAAQERWLLAGIVFGASLLLFLLGLLLRRRLETLLERLSLRGGRPDSERPGAIAEDGAAIAEDGAAIAEDGEVIAEDGEVIAEDGGDGARSSADGTAAGGGGEPGEDARPSPDPGDPRG